MIADSTPVQSTALAGWDSAESWRLLIQVSPAATIVLDHDGQVVLWNPAAARLFGWAPNEVLGQPHPIVPEEKRDEFQALFARVLQGETLTGLEIRRRRRDGQWVDVDAAAAPIPDSHGGIRGAMVVFTDQTERKQAERERDRLREQLEESEALLDETGRLARVGGWELDLATLQPRWTKEVYRIHEVPLDCQPTLDEAIHFYAPEARPIIEQAVRQAIAEGTPYDLELSFRTAKGRSLWVRAIGKAVCRDGKVVKLVGTFQDITERRQAEEERRRLEAQVLHVQKLESLGVLAGGIAHDFNNLLTSMLGYTSLALRELPTESPARPFLSEVERAASRAAELTQQMLAYAGKGRFVVHRLDLSSLVQEMVQLLQTVVSKKAVFQFDCAAGLPPIEADATQLRQVVMNLITNASDALGDGSGLIGIRTGVLRLDQPSLWSLYAGDALPGDYVFLEVTDNGQGMSPEIQARIFDPFFTTKFTGRGLGLAATLGIVRSHRGVIKVVSAPGRGSTFQVLLPRAESAPVEASHPARPCDSWLGKGTILVVDDEAGVRTVVGRMLQAVGFQVLTARDGTEGLELFERQGLEIVAVVLDLTMPRQGGLEVFRELRSLRPELPVFLMSGFSEEDLKTRCASLEVAGFLEKPFHFDKVVAVIRTGLEGRRKDEG